MKGPHLQEPRFAARKKSRSLQAPVTASDNRDRQGLSRNGSTKTEPAPFTAEVKARKQTRISGTRITLSRTCLTPRQGRASPATREGLCLGQGATSGGPPPLSTDVTIMKSPSRQNVSAAHSQRSPGPCGQLWTCAEQRSSRLLPRPFLASRGPGGCIRPPCPVRAHTANRCPLRGLLTAGFFMLLCAFGWWQC